MGGVSLVATMITRFVAITLILLLGPISCSDNSAIPQEHAGPIPEEPIPFITLVFSDSDTTLVVPESDSLCVDLPPGMSLGASYCIDLSNANGTGEKITWSCIGYDILDPGLCEIDSTPFNPDPLVVCPRVLEFGTHTLLIEVHTRPIEVETGQTTTRRFCVQFTIR